MVKILVTGAKGFIGQAVVKNLLQKNYNVSAIDKDYCDFSGNMDNIISMLEFEKPDAVIHCAGLIKGIMGNKENPYTMLTENLRMNTNFIDACRTVKIPRLLYLFCGCSYPAHAKNPIREESLFTGLPDDNSMYYSLGKAVNHLQVVACRKQYGLDWVSVVPGNAYGPGDNFDLNDSHVIAGLINKFHKAKINNDNKVICWGNGFPLRDFVYVDDVAEGVARALMRHHEVLPINIASGKGVSIKEVTEIVKEVVGFQGNIEWDVNKPNGQQVKIFDVERQEQILGFSPKIKLKEGIQKTYDWYLKNKVSV